MIFYNEKRNTLEKALQYWLPFLLLVTLLMGVLLCTSQFIEEVQDLTPAPRGYFRSLSSKSNAVSHT